MEKQLGINQFHFNLIQRLKKKIFRLFLCLMMYLDEYRRTLLNLYLVFSLSVRTDQ
jgi:hypothetical protein